jgi:hypothetical protein
MKLTAKGLYHIPGGKIGLQGITIKPSDEILALQTKVIQGNGAVSQVGRAVTRGYSPAVEPANRLCRETRN